MVGLRGQGGSPQFPPAGGLTKRKRSGAAAAAKKAPLHLQSIPHAFAPNNLQGPGTCESTGEVMLGRNLATFEATGKLSWEPALPRA